MMDSPLINFIIVFLIKNIFIALIERPKKFNNLQFHLKSNLILY
jgi:hypothetical protein